MPSAKLLIFLFSILLVDTRTIWAAEAPGRGTVIQIMGFAWPARVREAVVARVAPLVHQVRDQPGDLLLRLSVDQDGLIGVALEEGAGARWQREEVCSRCDLPRLTQVMGDAAEFVLGKYQRQRGVTLGDKALVVERIRWPERMQEALSGRVAALAGVLGGAYSVQMGPPGCDGAECWEQAATGDGLVLGASVQEGQVEVVLLGSGAGSGGRRAVSQRCAQEQCTLGEVGHRLGMAAERLVRDWQASQVVVAAPQGQSERKGLHAIRGLPLWRKVTGGVLGGLAAGALVAGITWAAMDGSPTDGSCVFMGQTGNFDCRLDSRVSYITSFALAGAFGVGMGLVLGLPARDRGDKP